VFRTMTRDAMVALDLPRDPTLRVSLPEPPLDDAEPNSLTPEQLAAFLEAMRMHYPQHYALVATLAYTGLRFCHASALRWEDWNEQTLRLDADQGVPRRLDFKDANRLAVHEEQVVRLAVALLELELADRDTLRHRQVHLVAVLHDPACCLERRVDLDASCGLRPAERRRRAHVAPCPACRT